MCHQRSKILAPPLNTSWSTSSFSVHSNKMDVSHFKHKFGEIQVSWNVFAKVNNIHRTALQDADFERGKVRSGTNVMKSQPALCHFMTLTQPVLKGGFSFLLAARMSTPVAACELNIYST